MFSDTYNCSNCLCALPFESFKAYIIAQYFIHSTLHCINCHGKAKQIIWNIPFGSGAKPESLGAEKWDVSSFLQTCPLFSTPSLQEKFQKKIEKLYRAELSVSQSTKVQITLRECREAGK